jgi:hypothetical protein
LGIIAVHLLRILEAYPTILAQAGIYDRRRQRLERDRGNCGCEGGRMRALPRAFIAGSLVFELALGASRRALAQQALAFAISNTIHGRAAGVAAVAGAATHTFPHRVVAAGSIAKNGRMFFCRVTTRGPGFDAHWGAAVRRRFGLARLALPSLPFRLSVPPPSFEAGTALLLTLGRLPAAQLLPALGVLAVALVMPPRLESPRAAFTEAASPARLRPTGGQTAVIGMLNLSHGR